MQSRRIVVLLVAGALSSCAPPPAQISGAATVIDGDSLEIAGASIRLYGVDAPEGRQSCTRDGASWACGEAATDALRMLTGANRIRCTHKDTDSYDRIVAVCTSGARDLGAELVRAGLALAYREFAGDYVDEEAEAREARRGIWAGTFTPPWDWRRNPPRDTAPTNDPTRSDGCLIKGNINREGERIYHVPGSSSYEQTTIDESRGERWFCSEDEAHRASWRAPRG